MTLDIITSDTLDVKHGFFTRAGGASSGIFAGLNCGYGSSDQRDIVQVNRSRVARALGVEDIALMGVHQVHSAEVVTITEPTEARERADAMVTNVPGIALGILTADCQPVLFADEETGVIGAAHAGWKGAMDGVLGNTVDAMIALGAKRDAISAVIGPAISQAAYEVGPEFAERFIDDNPENARFFVNGNDDRYHFDLPSYGLSQLRAAGVGSAQWTRHCTYSEPDRFFSFRKSVHRKEADYGRLISAICL